MLYACFHLTTGTDVVVGCRGMFSKEVIGKMKKGAFLVNNARGAIVDREAVVEACKSGQLGGACLTPPLFCHPSPALPLTFSQECCPNALHFCLVFPQSPPSVCLVYRQFHNCAAYHNIISESNSPSRVTSRCKLIMSTNKCRGHSKGFPSA